MSIAPSTVLLCLAMFLSITMNARAEDAWNPFKQKDVRERAGLSRERLQRQPLPTEQDATLGQAGPPVDATAASVERGDLPPVMANDGSGLPLELWQGLDLQTVEEHVARIEAPPPSPVARMLWKRIWTSTAPPPSGGQDGGHFFAIRIEALYRAGLLADLRQLLERESSRSSVLAGVVEARARIGLGDRDRGCALTRSIVGRVADLPKPLAVEALLMSGYCAAAEGNAAAAGLAADLARERQSADSLGLAVLEAIAAGTTPQARPTKRVSLLDYRLLQMASIDDVKPLLEKAEPALLAAVANDQAVHPATRIAAAEAASRSSAINSALLGEVYRAVTFTAEDLANPTRPAAPELKRALLLKAAEHERTPAAKARLLRTLLEDARRSGLHLQMTEIVAHQLGGLAPAPDAPILAEIALEASLAAGRNEQARRWTETSGLRHWLTLVAVADAKAYDPHGFGFDAVTGLALEGKLGSDALHRLATVLDALDFQVPIPLWEAANRAPQPAGGYLPETGILSQLQDAARKKELARTVLLAMRALGPEGPDGTHVLALGDVIKALKRAGLGNEAHRLGFESLFGSWPRRPLN